MKTLGIFVGENGNWMFFREIFQHLSQHFETRVHERRSYHTPLLHGRLNRWAFHRGISSILSGSDLCFFEWASELLVPASHMPKRCPIVTRLHSYELYAWAPKVNWAHVDRVILVSEAMRQKFTRLYPDHAHKAEVVYNARPLDSFRPGARSFSLDLGMVCSIHPRKRIYEVILMLHDLRSLGYDARLHIAGGRIHGGDLDEYFVAIGRLISKLGLQDSVILYGQVEETAEWLRSHVDIFISNSYWEGHQVALVEAMATGCHCLAHFWDGAEEVLPSENLYASEVELRDRIIEYCELPDSEKMERQSRMRAIACEKYDTARQHEEIRRIVEEVLLSRQPESRRVASIPAPVQGKRASWGSTE